MAGEEWEYKKEYPNNQWLMKIKNHLKLVSPPRSAFLGISAFKPI
jgi:hypothetical protein